MANWLQLPHMQQWRAGAGRNQMWPVTRDLPQERTFPNGRVATRPAEIRQGRLSCVVQQGGSCQAIRFGPVPVENETMHSIFDHRSHLLAWHTALRSSEQSYGNSSLRAMGSYAQGHVPGNNASTTCPPRLREDVVKAKALPTVPRKRWGKSKTGKQEFSQSTKYVTTVIKREAESCEDPELRLILQTQQHSKLSPLAQVGRLISQNERAQTDTPNVEIESGNLTTQSAASARQLRGLQIRNFTRETVQSTKSRSEEVVCDLPQLYELMKQRPLIMKENGEEVSGPPHEFDVTFGRGATYMKHSGNIYYRQLAAHCREEYKKRRKFAKIELSKAIVNHVQQRGGRFLVLANDSFKVASDKKAVDKTSQILRQEKNGKTKDKPQINTACDIGPTDDDSAATPRATQEFERVSSPFLYI